MAGFEEADVVLAIGYDLVEHSPEHWNPGRDKTIICIDSLPAEIDEYFMPEVELVGDIYHILVAAGRGVPARAALGRIGPPARAGATAASTPRRTTSTCRCIRRARCTRSARCSDARTSSISDVGLHKLWIGRMFPAYEPNTVLIANGLAGMGFAVPAAIAAKLVHPDRKVVTVNGDGGFLMNCQELETAVRLRTPFVNVIWENQQYGSIVWKQDKKFGEHFGVDFTNPDFVQARRVVRHARLALRVRRGLPARALAKALGRGPAVADRAADRLLARRGDL